MAEPSLRETAGLLRLLFCFFIYREYCISRLSRAFRRRGEEAGTVVRCRELSDHSLSVLVLAALTRLVWLLAFLGIVINVVGWDKKTGDCRFGGGGGLRKR